MYEGSGRLLVSCQTCRTIGICCKAVPYFDGRVKIRIPRQNLLFSVDKQLVKIQVLLCLGQKYSVLVWQPF
jgi:hypothetical protein